MEGEAKAAIPRLLLLLKDSNPDVTRAVNIALERIGTPSKVDLPLLHEALREQHTPTRIYAARMLARDGMMTRDGYDWVRVAALDENANVQESAVTALGNYVHGWRDSLPILIQLLRRSSELDPTARRTDHAVRENARNATLNLMNAMTERDGPEFVNFFKQRLILGDKSPSVRQLASLVILPPSSSSKRFQDRFARSRFRKYQ
jgi:HEAT repeat protein